MKTKDFIRKGYIYWNGIVKRIWRKVANPLEYSLVVSVGQACNLKCVNCANFCPISLLETKRYPLDSIIESLSTLIKNTWRISCLQIQGGEPFIYSDLTELLIWLKRQRKIDSILIATNGMVIPGKRVLDTIYNDRRITVRISDYNLSDMPVQLKGILDEKGIRNGYYKFAGGDDMWNDLGGYSIGR